MTNPNGWPDADHPGVPLNPERDGPHWIIGWKGKLFVAEWDAMTEDWSWGGGGESAGGVAGLGWGYAGPCLTPAEVEAKVKAAREAALEEAARLCDKRGGARPDDVERYRTHADRREAFRCAAAIRTLKGDTQ